MKMYHKLISNLEWALSCLSHPISLYLPNVEESKVKFFFGPNICGVKFIFDLCLLFIEISVYLYFQLTKLF